MSANAFGCKSIQQYPTYFPFPAAKGDYLRLLRWRALLQAALTMLRPSAKKVITELQVRAIPKSYSSCGILRQFDPVHVAQDLISEGKTERPDGNLMVRNLLLRTCRCFLQNTLGRGGHKSRSPHIRSRAVLYTEGKRECKAHGVSPDVLHDIVAKRTENVLARFHEMGYRTDIWDSNC